MPPAQARHSERRRCSRRRRSCEIRYDEKRGNERIASRRRPRRANATSEGASPFCMPQNKSTRSNRFYGRFNIFHPGKRMRHRPPGHGARRNGRVRWAPSGMVVVPTRNASTRFFFNESIPANENVWRAFHLKSDHQRWTRSVVCFLSTKTKTSRMQTTDRKGVRASHSSHPDGGTKTTTIYP